MSEKKEDKRKQPYIPLYTGDYIKDTRQLSLAAKGAWADIIFFMWAQETGGVMQGTIKDFARQIGGSPTETFRLLNEIADKKVCDGQPTKKGVFQISCRRLVRENAVSEARSQAVQTRYKTSTKTLQIADNDNGVVTGSEEKKEALKKVLNEIFSDEQYVEELQSVHRSRDLKQAFSECFMHHIESPTPPKELWQWRQKLNTWLTIKGENISKKPRKNNGKIQ